MNNSNTTLYALKPIYISTLDITLFCQDKNEYISVSDLSKTIKKYTGDNIPTHRFTIYQFNNLNLLIFKDALKILNIKLSCSQLLSFCTNIISELFLSYVHENNTEIYRAELNDCKESIINLGIVNTKLETELNHWRSLYGDPKAKKV
ncbi:hypothetical protein [Okeania sp. KiyG1]|uniref:hypothetical protein n=1 Tax=Okeania sp. KiyG1 TaxID=2720165 RepID=UPI001921A1D5|nr:hypothetical protein [Okeania sp. KiyG1]GGA57339.1 hypothetical protein CYANOKiyG1_78370 [Okeania sp. KiyG1]